MYHVHLIVGARPNFMKMAPLYNEFSLYPDKFKVKLVHTGQHYDARMSKLFFEDLQMPQPDIYLEVGSGSHGEQTARVLERYEKCLFEDRPDLVFVAGDVNSTLACALAAVKLCIPVAHVEAGLRSYDRSMPEEINRLLTDQIAQYLLTPSPDADTNLLKEGIPDTRIHRVGNIMIDSLVRHRQLAEQSTILHQLGLRTTEGLKKYCLVTLHRPSNVDSREDLSIVLEALKQINEPVVIVFPMHPRTRNSLIKLGLEPLLQSIPRLIVTEPLGYLDFINLEMQAALVITDSGGIQEETTFLRIPCLTLRQNTERPITVSEGTNQLVSLDSASISRAVLAILGGNIKQGGIPALWDGHTAERIVRIFG